MVHSCVCVDKASSNLMTRSGTWQNRSFNMQCSAEANLRQTWNAFPSGLNGLLSAISGPLMEIAASQVGEGGAHEN